MVLLRTCLPINRIRLALLVTVACAFVLAYLLFGGIFFLVPLTGPALALLGGRLDRVQPLEIPGRDWDHRAAWIAKAAPTPGKYPRRAGAVEKRPL